MTRKNTGAKWLFRRAKYGFKNTVGMFKEPASKDIEFRIRRGYRHRIDNAFFDDTGLTDQYQREVYETAAEIGRTIRAKSVFDVGCGSGYKLMHHFEGVETVGFDLEPTLTYLRGKYPGRSWREADFVNDAEQADLVICADVVEHIPNPDVLMRYLARVTRKNLVISTPDRLTVYGWDHSGPPRNRAHCREWDVPEFKAYVGQWFDIEDHRITSETEATQMIVGVPKGAQVEC